MEVPMHQPSPTQFASVLRVAPVAQTGAWRVLAVRLAGAAMALVRLPARIMAIRRDMALLGAMSDGELSDIGLMRQDLWDASLLPFGTHPGALLSERVESRKRRRWRR
jgi:uncharacterized protein YjiS (DUF1127 family)